MDGSLQVFDIIKSEGIDVWKAHGGMYQLTRNIGQVLAHTLKFVTHDDIDDFLDRSTMYYSSDLTMAIVSVIQIIVKENMRLVERGMKVDVSAEVSHTLRPCPYSVRVCGRKEFQTMMANCDVPRALCDMLIRLETVSNEAAATAAATIFASSSPTRREQRGAPRSS